MSKVTCKNKIQIIIQIIFYISARGLWQATDFNADVKYDWWETECRCQRWQGRDFNADVKTVKWETECRCQRWQARDFNADVKTVKWETECRCQRWQISMQMSKLTGVDVTIRDASFARAPSLQLICRWSRVDSGLHTDGQSSAVHGGFVNHSLLKTLQTEWFFPISHDDWFSAVPCKQTDFSVNHNDGFSAVPCEQSDFSVSHDDGFSAVPCKQSDFSVSHDDGFSAVPWKHNNFFIFLVLREIHKSVPKNNPKRYSNAV